MLRRLVTCALLSLAGTAGGATLHVNANLHDIAESGRGADADLLLRTGVSERTDVSIGAATHDLAGARWRYAVSGANWRSDTGGAHASLQAGNGNNGSSRFSHLVAAGGGYRRLEALPLNLDLEYKHVDSDGPRQSVLSVGASYGLRAALWARVQYTGARSADGASDTTVLVRGDYAVASFNAWLGAARGQARLNGVARRLPGSDGRRDEWLFAGVGIPRGRQAFAIGVSRLWRDGESSQSTLSLNWRTTLVR